MVTILTIFHVVAVKVKRIRGGLSEAMEPSMTRQIARRLKKFLERGEGREALSGKVSRYVSMRRANCDAGSPWRECTSGVARFSWASRA